PLPSRALLISPPAAPDIMSGAFAFSGAFRWSQPPNAASPHRSPPTNPGPAPPTAAHAPQQPRKPPPPQPVNAPSFATKPRSIPTTNSTPPSGVGAPRASGRQLPPAPRSRRPGHIVSQSKLHSSLPKP